MEAPASGTRWRDVLPIHPAAELLPLISAEELRELADDIVKNGLREPVTFMLDPEQPDDDEPDRFVLIDGRNRLDAIELLGYDVIGGKKFDPNKILQDGDAQIFQEVLGEDPFAYIISKNIRRRHLTSEQKRELVAKLLKLNAERSDRQVAALVGVDHKTVGAVRKEEEGRGEIPHVVNRTDTKGRKQPSRKSVGKATSKPEPDATAAPPPVSGKKSKYRRGHLANNKDFDPELVEYPKQIRINILDSISRSCAVAQAYKKILKVAFLDQGVKDEVSAAISKMIAKWQSLQAGLAPTDIAAKLPAADEPQVPKRALITKAADKKMRRAWEREHPDELPLPEHLCELEHPNLGYEETAAKMIRWINDYERRPNK